MIHLAFCDDDVATHRTMHEMLSHYMNLYPQYELKIYFFTSPMELLCYAEKNISFDILLLDIYMKGMSGIEAAKEFRQKNTEAGIIFITASREHALDAFSVDAAQYLVKPYEENELFAALNKVFKSTLNGQKEKLILKTASGIIYLKYQDIVFTETSKKNYQIIHMIQGEAVEIRMTSAELFQHLSTNQNFFRCGASFNLNLQYIRQITREAVFFDTGESVAIPYSSYKKIKEKFFCLQMNTDI
jgi:DNA-binding LytR/AlgR family response regulator